MVLAWRGAIVFKSVLAAVAPPKIFEVARPVAAEG
jgi:hypothetical protein